MAQDPDPVANLLTSALEGNKGMPAIDRYLRGDGAPPGIVDSPGVHGKYPFCWFAMRKKVSTSSTGVSMKRFCRVISSKLNDACSKTARNRSVSLFCAGLRSISF